MSGVSSPGSTGVERIAAALVDLGGPGERVRRQVPLAPFTTYRVGGPAALLVTAGSEDDLVAVADALRPVPEVAVVVIGRGSNLLVADAGFDGVAVVLGPEFDWVDLGLPTGGGAESAAVTVRAGGATALPVLARRTAGAGFRGMEWAVGVPGSVGGGVRMNAGGHGSDMASVLVDARVVSLRTGGRVGPDPVRSWPVGEMAYGYRRSALQPSDVVVAAAFGLVVGEPAEAEAEVAAVVRWRRANQPGGPNAGSVFANPPGHAAGRLIEAAGLKGERLGTAAVSEKHANFIQSDEGGRASDVRSLMALIRRRVADDTGVLLEPEVRLVGFDDVEEWPQP